MHGNSNIKLLLHLSTYTVLQWFDVLRNLIIFSLQKWIGVAAISFKEFNFSECNYVSEHKYEYSFFGQIFVTKNNKRLAYFTSTATSSPVIFIGWETLREMNMKALHLYYPTTMWLNQCNYSFIACGWLLL
jgi:hypothetical protein